jgi:lysophospholipase L1-like esterase
MAIKFFRLLQAAAIPILFGLIWWNECAYFVGWFRLVSFILFFLAVADLAAVTRGAVRDGLMVFASLVFGLCLIEAAANIIEPKPSVSTQAGLYEKQPVIGSGPSHSGRFHDEKRNPRTGATIYSADYTIDTNLLRETHSSNTDPTIVFFGDSMTFGVGVDDADTLPQIFADSLDPKQRVLNLAFGGHGPQHFLRELESGIYDPLIGSHARVFIYLTAAWHAERMTCKQDWVRSGPRYVLEKGEVVFKGPCFEGDWLWWREWLQNMASYRQFIEPVVERVTHNDIELYIETLAAAVKQGKQKYGAPTILPYIQVWGDYLHGTGFTDEIIVKRLRDAGAIVLDMSLKKEQADGAKISIAGDGHPTPLANRLRAEMLKNYIEQHVPGALLSKLE